MQENDFVSVYEEIIFLFQDFLFFQSFYLKDFSS